MAKSVWFLGISLMGLLGACSSSSTTGGSATGGASAIEEGTGGASSSGTGGASSTNGTLVVDSDCSGTFSACGGDPTGTWKYSDLCFEGDMTQAYNDYEESKYGAACKNLIQSVTIGLSGTYTFSEGTITFDTTSSNSMERIYTSDCLTAMAGSASTVTSDFCTSFEARLSAQEGVTAVCAFDGTDCACAQTTTTSSTGTDTYSVSDNTLVWGDGTSTEFCILDDSLTELFATDFGFNYRTTMVKQ